VKTVFLVKKTEAERFVVIYTFFSKGLKKVLFSDLHFHCADVREVSISVLSARLFLLTLME